MPSCFSLTPKGESEPRILQEVDDKMWVDFGGVPDPDKWFRNWYNWLGLALACGRTFEDIAETFSDMPGDIEVIKYIEEHYTVNSWYQHK